MSIVLILLRMHGGEAVESYTGMSCLEMVLNTKWEKVSGLMGDLGREGRHSQKEAFDFLQGHMISHPYFIISVDYVQSNTHRDRNPTFSLKVSIHHPIHIIPSHLLRQH